MPNYYDYRRMNELRRRRNVQSGDNSTSATGYGMGSEKRSDDLVIDDNSVYEIDPECFERIKKSKGNQR